MAVRVLGAMLLPQHHQRHAASLQLLVHLAPVGNSTRRALVEAGWREQPPLQLGVANRRRDRPRDADHLGPGHVLGNCRLADACCLAHLTDAEPQLMRQPQDLTDLPHRHSHPRHRPPPVFLDRGADQLIRMSTGAMPASVISKLSAITGTLSAMRRKTVRDGPESAVGWSVLRF